MKKFLTVSALVLSIATSMVAGTLAIYSTKLDKIEGNIETKAFDLSMDNVIHPNVQLAPGEETDWRFKVTNTSKDGIISEVPMGMDIAVTLPKEMVDAGIKAEIGIYHPTEGLVKPEGTGFTESQEGNVFFFKDNFTFPANIKGFEQYVIRFGWAADSASDEVQTAIQNTSGKIEVSISGTQYLG